uniref:SRCR domain-containing protein n=1 Tax=Athene cunicularia TaxID=194338 RepID=A0A663MXY1_ATHCN
MCPVPGPRLRLSGGRNGCEGRVELYNGEGSWGTVCDDMWDLRDAQVVCRQLGCGQAVAAPGSARFGLGSGRIFLDDVQCRGDEPSLQMCRHRGWGVHNCGHVEDASVICAESDSNLSLMLVNGRNRCGGHVEVHYQGSWGTVYGDSWDLREAQVTCSQLGCGRAVSTPGNANFSQGSGEILFTLCTCKGTESHLWDCQHGTWSSHNCGHHEDVSVICSDPFAPSLRLADGDDQCSGRVELYHNGSWGTVCDDAWELADAKVVCRSLGCGEALQALSEARFGQGSGRDILLDNVACTGVESSLEQCSQRGLGTHDCYHKEDAGIICEDTHLFHFL